MKTIFQAMARYNGNVNFEIMGLLGGMPPEKLAIKTKAYYSTIMDTALHILLSDIGLFRRFKASFPESKALSIPLLNADTVLLKKEVEVGLEKYFQYRKEIDGMINQFVVELDDAVLARSFKYTNYKGEPVETNVWKMLLMIFNHQIHHRGALSVMLELEDVKNDFSGTLSRI